MRSLPFFRRPAIQSAVCLVLLLAVFLLLPVSASRAQLGQDLLLSCFFLAGCLPWLSPLEREGVLRYGAALRFAALLASFFSLFRLVFSLLGQLPVARLFTGHWLVMLLSDGLFGLLSLWLSMALALVISATALEQVRLRIGWWLLLPGAGYLILYGTAGLVLYPLAYRWMFAPQDTAHSLFHFLDLLASASLGNAIQKLSLLLGGLLLYSCARLMTPKR